MIEYYIKQIENVGGESNANYITGLALIINDEVYTIEIKEEDFFLTSKRSNHKHYGDPLDEIKIDPILNKYYTEMTDEDAMNRGFKFDKEVTQFIEDNLLKRVS